MQMAHSEKDSTKTSLVHLQKLLVKSNQTKYYLDSSKIGPRRVLQHRKQQFSF